MKISYRPVGGVAPGINPRYLPEGFGQAASNCKLWEGTLKPWKGLSAVIVDGTDAPLALYRFGQNDPANGDTQWWWTLPWNASIARGPVRGDANETTYFTYENPAGSFNQRVTDKTGALGGGASPQPSSRYMGVPAPTAKATLSAQGAADTKATKETRYYTYCYVNSAGQPSDLAPASAAVVIQASTGTDHYARVTLTKPSTNVDYRCAESGAQLWIYRSATGTSSTQFLFVGYLQHNGSAWTLPGGQGLASFVDIDATTMRVDDQVLGSALGDVAESAGWLPPPADLRCLRSMPGGLHVGITKNGVAISDPEHPFAWPLANQHALDYQPVALGVFGSTCVVATNGMPYILTGTEPTAMAPQRIERQQACVSFRSMVELGGGVAYASPDGLCMVDGSGLEVVSSKFFNRDRWQALRPASIHACAWDGRYVMFYDADGNSTWTDGIVWDFSTGPTTLNVGDIRAMFADLVTDTLYLADQLGRVRRFDTDANAPLSFTHKSPVYRLPAPANFGWAMVHAASYAALTLKVTADGVLRLTQVVASRAPFVLPSGFTAMEWELEISGTDEVFAVVCAESFEELLSGG